jgi:PAS domain S-box-containing protein
MGNYKWDGPNSTQYKYTNWNGGEPNDKALQELNAESYVGTTLWSFDGKPIGLIAIIGSKPLKNTNLAENILRLVSVRASGELERKKAELQNKKLSIAIEQSPTSIEITDTDGKIEYVNKKFVELTGYSYEEVIGKNPRILSSGKTNPLVFVDLWKTITTGLTWSGELINKRKDGTEFIEFAIIAPITDDNGLITNYVAIKEDVTASKIANEELRLGVVKLHKSEMALRVYEKEKEVNDLKARFVSTASHEFRNPLAVIMLTNESLINYWERLDRDQIKTKLDRIRSQVTHLSSIVNDVLQVSKIQEGKQVLRKKEVDLVLLCKDVISDFDETKSSHDIEFECNTSSVLIEIDLRLIGQALNNLISNALKYSTDANPIFVRIESTDHEVIVKVQDSGIGIPLVDQKHLFEPFFRANNCTMIPGNGLGLNIAREIIRQHGGDITFVSKENKGTTFEFNLPIK